MNIVSLIGLLNTIISLILFSLLLFNNKKIKILSFILFIFYAFFWSFFYFLWSTAIDVNSAIKYMKLLMLGGFLLAPGLLNFISEYVGNQWSIYKLILYHVFFILISFVFVFSPNYFDNYIILSNGIIWPQAGIIFTLSLIIWLCILVITFFILIKKFILDINFRSNINNKYVLVGLIIAYIGGITNYFYFYNIHFLPYGNISTSIFVVIIFYAIFVHNAFEVKIATTKFIRYLFFSIYSYIIFYILNYIYVKFFGSIWVKEVLAISVLIAPTFAYFLFKLDKISDWINFKLFGNLNRHQDVLNAILDFINTNIEDDKILKFVNKTLTKFLNIKAVKLINLPTVKTKLNIEIKKVFKEYRQGYICYENQILKKNLNNIYCGVLFKIKTGNEFLLYCEADSRDLLFTKDDLTLISSIANQIEYSFDRSDLYKQVKDYNQELEKKVEIRTDELEVQKKTLQNMLGEKEETLHLVSHQIKTPLSIMNSSYQMWKDGLWSFEKTIEVIKSELNRLKNTVDLFFKAQQDDSYKRELNATLNDFNVLIEEIIKEKKEVRKVVDSNIKINISSNFAKLQPFYFDPKSLIEVVSNVIDNAIAYTKSIINIDVNLQVIKNKNYINIIIEDDGIGIAKEDIDFLFEKFKRTDNAKKIRPDGNGLGLYVCKQMVKQMHGKISVESEGVGKGAKFTISLPYNLKII